MRVNKRGLIIIIVLLLLIVGGVMTAFLLPDSREPLPHTPHDAIRPVTTGSFTQPWALETYTGPEQWDAEFETMQSAGIDLWIFQWTGDSARKTTIYPTSLPGWTHSMRYDVIEMGLAAAERRGMHVFMGLAFNDAWWQKQGSDARWLADEAAKMNAVAAELYERYYSRYPSTFAGWYINWEMDNASGYNFRDADKQNMIRALAEVSGQLKQLNPALPVSIAPYFNAGIGANGTKKRLGS